MVITKMRGEGKVRRRKEVGGGRASRSLKGFAMASLICFGSDNIT